MSMNTSKLVSHTVDLSYFIVARAHTHTHTPLTSPLLALSRQLLSYFTHSIPLRLTALNE
jgi:hypothetical protein